MASLVKDYTKYKDTRNVTFIGICTSSTATVKSMTAQVERFALKPFANMLDMGGTTAAAYGVPANAKFWLILIDGEGKIAYNDASAGWFWTSGPDSGKTVFQTQLEQSFAKSKGLLGDAYLPTSMMYAAHLYDLQQFDLMDKELAKADAPGAVAEQKTVATMMRGKVADVRKKRLEQIQALAQTDPVQGYREAIAFVEAFPKAPEMPALRTIGTKLASEEKVKRELQAEAAYQQTMVPEMKKVTTTAAFTKIQPMFDGYAKAFSGTKYVEVVKNAVESLRIAVKK